jgi:hypothetical protein
MAAEPHLPARVFAEGFSNGRQTPEAKAVASSLTAAGVPAACIITATEAHLQSTHRKTLTRADVVVGNPNFVRLGLQQLGVALPAPPDYPNCLGMHISIYYNSRSCSVTLLVYATCL